MANLFSEYPIQLAGTSGNAFDEMFPADPHYQGQVHPLPLDAVPRVISTQPDPANPHLIPMGPHHADPGFALAASGRVGRGRQRARDGSRSAQRVRCGRSERHGVFP